MKKALLFGIAVLALLTIASAAEEQAAGGDDGMKFFSAGLAVGLAGLGAGYAIAKVGAASAGSITENPSLFGNTILYVAFAEAIAIYGLLVALMIVMG